MGKHSSDSTERRGSVKDLLAGRTAGTSGRHSDARKLSAATVLSSANRKPVLAAIAVPTAAIMAVAVAGLVGAPESQADSEVVSAAEAPQTPGETEAAETTQQEVNPKDSAALQEARKAAKEQKAQGTASLQTPEPKPAAQKSASGSGGSKPSSKSSSSGGSSKSTEGSKKSSSKKSSGRGSDSSSGRSNTEDDYKGSMSKKQIEQMLLDSSNGKRWHRIAKCESNFNPRAVNPAGYYGLFQFSRSTWKSVGGSGSPEKASPQEQFKRAKILQAKAGWGQWGCK